jgi:hypothetical protein
VSDAVPTKRRVGRPPTELGRRENFVLVSLHGHEQRRLDALLSHLGRRGRATIMRDLLLEKADQLDIQDPGPDADKGAEVTAA